MRDQVSSDRPRPTPLKTNPTFSESPNLFGGILVGHEKEKNGDVGEGKDAKIASYFRHPPSASGYWRSMSRNLVAKFSALAAAERAAVFAKSQNVPFLLSEC